MYSHIIHIGNKKVYNNNYDIKIWIHEYVKILKFPITLNHFIANCFILLFFHSVVVIKNKK